MDTRSLVPLATAHDLVIKAMAMIPDAALDWLPNSEDWSLKAITGHLAHANDFYVMIVEEARASAFGDVRLHFGLAGFQQMAATDAAVAQCRTATDALACLSDTYWRLLIVLDTVTAEELDRRFSISYSWQPDVEPELTTLRTRVLEIASSHLHEHHVQMSETLRRWYATKQPEQSAHDSNYQDLQRNGGGKPLM